MLSLLYWNIRMQMMFPMNPNRDTNEVITPTIQNSTLEFNSDILFIFLKLVRHWKIQQHYLQYIITEFLVGFLFFTVSITYNYPHCKATHTYPLSINSISGSQLSSPPHLLFNWSHKVLVYLHYHLTTTIFISFSEILKVSL